MTNSKRLKKTNPEQYARLKAEIASPYKGLRQVIYLACGASSFIGGMIFIVQIAAGRQVESTLPNLAVQVGVLALMIFLFRLEQKTPKSKQ